MPDPSVLQDLSDIFSKQGALAAEIEGYRARDEQLQLALAVMDTLMAKGCLVAEAGTGTGKTFAYLVPALLSDQKVILSTGTKALQDQLFLTDLPRIKKALAWPGQIALLKGRANYLCLHRIQLHSEQGNFDSLTLAKLFQSVKKKLPMLKRGEVSEFSDIEENSPLWPYVTSTADNCLGTECEYYEDCYLVKARKRALAAKLVVINHHLFFADSQLKDEGFSDILPTANTVIFDEAHQLPAVASHFFGDRLTSRQLLGLVQDSLDAIHEHAPELKSLLLLFETLQNSVHSFRSAFGEFPQKLPWSKAKNLPNVSDGLTDILMSLTDIEQSISDVLEIHKAFNLLLERVEIAKNIVSRLLNEPSQQKNEHIKWLETFKRSFILHTTPISVANAFNQCMNEETSYIFTSATLSVNNKFSHFCDQLGLLSPRLLQLDSPFNYPEQAMLYLPRGLPEPRDPSFIDKLLQRALTLIDVLGGKTLLLFTSYKSLHQSVDWLREHSNYSLLVQGEGSKQSLLDKFKRNDGAILLATSSFWEGVDIRGDALSLVVIDKLPFESPYEPVAQARIQLLKRQGREPFNDHQLPQAVIALKQGVGRLIRGESDFGIMMIGDPRLYGRAYGEHFLTSLPNMTRTRSENEAIAFVNKHLEVVE